MGFEFGVVELAGAVLDDGGRIGAAPEGGVRIGVEIGGGGAVLDGEGSGWFGGFAFGGLRGEGEGEGGAEEIAAFDWVHERSLRFREIVSEGYTGWVYRYEPGAVAAHR